MLVFALDYMAMKDVPFPLSTNFVKILKPVFLSAIAVNPWVELKACK
jgi:hypothetical protein